MAMSYVMKVSANGQVSIPAEARARWGAKRMLVVDMGDKIVIRPVSDDPLTELIGKYKGRGPSTDEARKIARDEDARREARRNR